MVMGVYCVKCKHKELEPKFDKWPCMDCCDGDRSEPITNYDLLISKTPEELAKALVAIAAQKRPSTYTAEGFCLDDGETSATDWLSWLKSPGEVDNGT